MDNTTSPSSCDMAVATETVFGSHMLTIDGYTKKTAALAVGEIIKSDRFHVGGHNWYIEFCPRWKDEEGIEWLSVFLCLDHHGSLEVEVKASPKFTLQDRAGKTIQSYGSRYWRQHTFSTTAEDALAWGTTDEFIQRKALETHLLIQDDDYCRIRCDVTVIKDKEAPPPPVPSLHGRHLGDLLLASEVGRDVTFVVDGEHFTAHSCVLAARTSTAFIAEVFAGKETAAVCRHVRIDGIKTWVFRALLHFIYTDALPNVEDEDAADIDARCARSLLEVAHRYDMERLKMVCIDVLCSNIYATTALHLLDLSQRHGCPKLNQACVKFISHMLHCCNLEERNRWLQP